MAARRLVWAFAGKRISDEILRFPMINGQAIIIEVKQPGCDFAKLAPVSTFAMTQNDERKVVIAPVQVTPDLCAVSCIKMYRLLSLHPCLTCST